MKNAEVARLFELMADLLEVRGDNPFRIRAYRRASQSLESLGEDVEILAREDQAAQYPHPRDGGEEASQDLGVWRLRRRDGSPGGGPDGGGRLRGDRARVAPARAQGRRGRDRSG